MFNFLKSSILVIVFFVSISVFSQEYKLSKDYSSIIIIGTSSLQDWKVEVEDFSGILFFNKKTKNITNLKIKIVSESLVGEKKGMNKKIYKALKTNAYKEIVFVNDTFQEIEQINNSESKIKLKGNLNIAGVTKPIELLVLLKQRSEKIEISGDIELNMEEFSIKPPRALFGTVKVKEKVTIKFNTVFE